MTIIDEIVAQLQASGCVAQAQPATRRQAAATATHQTLGEVISPLVDGRVQLLQQPAQPRYPNVVFQPQGAQYTGPDGLSLIRTDRYALHIRDTASGPLLEVTDRLRSGLINHAAADRAIGFDVTDQTLALEHDAQWRILMQVQAYSLAAAAQSIPAAFVYAAGQKATDAATPSTTQTVKSRYQVAIVDAAERIDTTQRAVTDALLGYTPSSGDYRSGLALVEGELQQHYGPLALWRNSYAITEFISA